MPYTILIADDHSIVRSGIRALFREQVTSSAVDEAANEEEIVRKMKATPYDLILLDINIPGTDFVNLVTWLQSAYPITKVLVFSTHHEEIYGKRCLQLGARGFLNKTASNEEIVAAVKKVLSGEVYLTAELQRIMSGSGSEGIAVNPFDKLSSRELEIARLIRSGHALPEICKVLNIQYSTANSYKRRIFEKLDVHNAVTLVELMRTFSITE